MVSVVEAEEWGLGLKEPIDFTFFQGTVLIYDSRFITTNLVLQEPATVQHFVNITETSIKYYGVSENQIDKYLVVLTVALMWVFV